LEKQPNRPLPGGKVRDLRADPYLKSMLLGLIEDSYLHTGTFTQFAAEVLQVIVYAVTVPVAFTEGFLKAYLSIERVVEEADGRIKIIPKAGASIEDMIRDVNEITAQVDPGAVFNPVVRAKLEAVHETSSKAMKWDIDTLSRMDDARLMDVLREMQAESERVTGDEQLQSDESTDYVRARIATIRRNVRRFQAQHAAGESDGVDGAVDGAVDASSRVAEGVAAAKAPHRAGDAPNLAGDAPGPAAV
ncbi:MAG: hypothetical protein NTX16_13795, partial [Actinobacteria bacterium]|nr:hypothetical protein [Actinomycetota bacterium]